MAQWLAPQICSGKCEVGGRNMNVSIGASLEMCLVEALIRLRAYALCSPRFTHLNVHKILLNQYSPVPRARSLIAGKDASTDLCRLRNTKLCMRVKCS